MINKITPLKLDIEYQSSSNLNILELLPNVNSIKVLSIANKLGGEHCTLIFKDSIIKINFEKKFEDAYWI